MCPEAAALGRSVSSADTPHAGWENQPVLTGFLPAILDTPPKLSCAQVSPLGEPGGVCTELLRVRARTQREPLSLTEMRARHPSLP